MSSLHPIKIDSIVKAGVCVGCGACAGIEPRLKMVRDSHGSMVVSIEDVSLESLERASSVCPIANPNYADELDPKARWGSDLKYDPRIGAFSECFAGSVVNLEDRVSSSSGGLTNWICKRLLEEGHVDGVVHLVPSTMENGEGLFGFSISRSVQELVARRKSHYYSASIDQVIRHVSECPGRFAFVGVPCYARAVRMISDSVGNLNGKFPYIIGIVCGHMKSAAFSEYLGWASGVHWRSISAIDFRVKDSTRPAYGYGIKVSSSGGEDRLSSISDIFASNWGYALFQLNACNYCDDIFAESADVALGDAWIRPYSSDWRGTNVAVVRHPVISKLLREGCQAGVVELVECGVEKICESQAGNFRHRWDGFAVRSAELSGSPAVPRPRRKVSVGSISARRKQLILARLEVSRISHELFKLAKSRNDLSIFIEGIKPLVEKIDALGRSDRSAFRRFISSILRVLR